jgi:hypothetical protein
MGEVDFEAELAALEEEETARAVAEAAEKKKLRHKELTLVREFSAKLGKRGVDFEVVPTPFDVFVVGVPDYIRYKQFLDKAGGDEAVEAAQQFSASCMLTPVAEFNAIASKRPGVAVQTSNAAIELAGLLEKKRQKK